MAKTRHLSSSGRTGTRAPTGGSGSATVAHVSSAVAMERPSGWPTSPPSRPRPRPASVACRGGNLVVSWSPDGHESRHELARLRARCACCELTCASSEARERWDAATEGIPARRTLDELRADESALEAWLAAVAASGIAVLGGVGTSEGGLNGVVELFGFIRETNYGRIFDVVTTVDPRNLAFTSLPLGPHTDNPYREPPPSLQLLHCLASSPAGGESIFVDGLEAAKRLAEEDPDAFAPERLCGAMEIRRRVDGADLPRSGAQCRSRRLSRIGEVQRAGPGPEHLHGRARRRAPSGLARLRRDSRPARAAEAVLARAGRGRVLR